MSSLTLVILFAWVLSIALLGVQYLKFYRYQYSEYFPLKARRYVDRNRTGVDRRPFAGLGIACVGLLLVFVARDVIHDARLAGYILAALLTVFGLLVLWNIPVAIKQRIEWYKKLPRNDQQIYRHYWTLLRNVYICGAVLLAVLFVSLRFIG